MSALKVFLDEDLPGKARDLLVSMGLDVAYVPDARIKGLRNGDLLARAAQEGRVLITRDKGFLRKGRYPAGTHVGIVFVRLALQNTPNLLEVLQTFFSDEAAARISGQVVILSERGHRSAP